MSEIVRYSVFVSGRVQGVGYRYFVQDLAVRLELRGWVRNLRDGRVEADIEGSEPIIHEFLEHLRQGPPFSHVSALDVKKLETPANHTGFRITRDA
ncbi:acylphosphatase [bacterium]|nr:acylphosphatase [bacterium]MBU1636085.1 acylphosphatase [bacterium]MBU1919393.1 acylphosphatase [bacterium]